MMRAHRRMPRGVGEWLAEGDGRIPVGCCVITAGMMFGRGFVMVVRRFLTGWMQKFEPKTYTKDGSGNAAAFLSKPFVPLH